MELSIKIKNDLEATTTAFVICDKSSLSGQVLAAGKGSRQVWLR